MVVVVVETAMGSDEIVFLAVLARSIWGLDIRVVVHGPHEDSMAVWQWLDAGMARMRMLPPTAEGYAIAYADSPDIAFRFVDPVCSTNYKGPLVVAGAASDAEGATRSQPTAWAFWPHKSCVWLREAVAERRARAIESSLRRILNEGSARDSEAREAAVAALMFKDGAFRDHDGVVAAMRYMPGASNWWTVLKTLVVVWDPVASVTI